ncbi:integrin alpha-V-like [Etheostoma cragini]|uniref:integrin alpha-V-like n=1 Tax=Etheostoma cragini TaxID=417921 RepID=UPI00155E04C7|nr:integrin alpha-V-like [Etheostoma cragini]
MGGTGEDGDGGRGKHNSPSFLPFFPTSFYWSFPPSFLPLLLFPFFPTPFYWSFLPSFLPSSPPLSLLPYFLPLVLSFLLSFFLLSFLPSFPQAHILLDCGDDNICKPNLKLSVKSDRQQIYIGDDNALTLEISAENQGEGAYEAELHVYPPQQADFTGVVRSQTLSRLSCAYKKENQTKMVVCDLGNPMKGGTKVLAELKFSVHQLSEEDTSVKFDLQIVSSNQFDNTSPRVSSVTSLAVLAKVSIRGTSSPGQVLLPIANWKTKEPPVVGDDIGPLIVHVYEVRWYDRRAEGAVGRQKRSTKPKNNAGAQGVQAARTVSTSLKQRYDVISQESEVQSSCLHEGICKQHSGSRTVPPMRRHRGADVVLSRIE